MITREELECDVEQRLTVEEISKKRKFSYTTIRYWLRKYGLKTNPEWNLYKKHSNEQILQIAGESTSYTNFLKQVSNTASGGAYYHYKDRLKSVGFDFDVFNQNRLSKKHSSLVGRRERLSRKVLNKLLIDSGRKVECEDCGISEWRGKKLVLPIHHKDKNRENNLTSNLCYLCPNCHSAFHFGV